jgi:hypothetical protein
VIWGIVIPVALLVAAVGVWLLLRDTSPRPPGPPARHRDPGRRARRRDPRDFPVVPDEAPRPASGDLPLTPESDETLFSTAVENKPDEDPGDEPPPEEDK